MAKTVLVLIVLVMFSIGLFIVSKVGVFLKESKKRTFGEARSPLILLRGVCVGM